MDKALWREHTKGLHCPETRALTTFVYCAVLRSAELPGCGHFGALRDLDRNSDSPDASSGADPAQCGQAGPQLPGEADAPCDSSVLSCPASCRGLEAGGESDPDPEGGRQRGLPRLTPCFQLPQDTPSSSPKCTTAVRTPGRTRDCSERPESDVRGPLLHHSQTEPAGKCSDT